MAMARPAALPIAVAITPTIKAIRVDVITPRIISPFGSKRLHNHALNTLRGADLENANQLQLTKLLLIGMEKISKIQIFLKIEV
jgi:hypothetical protein